jgi:peroxiredoxin
MKNLFLLGVNCKSGSSRVFTKEFFMRAAFQVAILLLGMLAPLSPTAARAEAVVGEAAPRFIAATLDGKSFDLSALKGKVVVVAFWATWAPACRDELFALEAVWRKYHGQGLEVLAISVDRPRARRDVDEVMRTFSFPAAMLDAVTKNDLVALDTVPVTYVIGKVGKVEKIFSPPSQPLTETTLGDDVKALLDAKVENPAGDSKEKPDDKT